MANIPSPSVKNAHPDRHVSCQEAIEADFQLMIESALQAGWGENEAASAIVDLAGNRTLSRFADDETEAVMKLLKRMT